MLASPAAWRGFQTEVLRAIMEREDYWIRFARLHPGQDKLVICDRGTMDGMAYAGPELFAEILHDLGLTTQAVRDGRYDGVLHMVTPAIGAPDAYTTANNLARRESVEEAAALDNKTRDAWVGHRNLHIVGNHRVVGRSHWIDVQPGLRTLVEARDVRITFDEKLEWALQEVCRMLDLPVPQRREAKYVIADPGDLAQYGVAGRTAHIVQHYLPSAEEAVERRIRKATGDAADLAAGTLYTYAEKRRHIDGTTTKHERVISARQYRELFATVDVETRGVVKTRTSFSEHNLYFHLDRVSEPEPLVLLEVETTEEQPTITLPSWVQDAVNVTANPHFQNASLARR
jgi:CYTH domain-containing protein